MKQFLRKLNKIDTFSPYFFLPFILLLYFFTSMFDWHRFEMFNLHVSIWPAVILAVICYYIGVYVIDKMKWTIPSFGLSFLGKYVIHFIVFLTLLGLCSYLLMVFGSGLGISDESNRRNLNPKLNFFSQLLWFGVLLLLSYKMILEKHMTWKKGFIYGSIYAFIIFFICVSCLSNAINYYPIYRDYHYPLCSKTSEIGVVFNNAISYWCSFFYV